MQILKNFSKLACLSLLLISSYAMASQSVSFYGNLNNLTGDNIKQIMLGDLGAKLLISLPVHSGQTVPFTLYPSEYDANGAFLFIFGNKTNCAVSYNSNGLFLGATPSCLDKNYNLSLSGNPTNGFTITITNISKPAAK